MSYRFRTCCDTPADPRFKHVYGCPEAEAERVKEMQDVYDLIIATCQEDPEFKAWGASALRFLNALEAKGPPVKGNKEGGGAR